MIKHVVMYKLKSTDDRNKLVDLFMTMKGNIPSLIDIQSGFDLLGLDRSYDVCLICTLESMEKLNEYTNFPFHKSIASQVKMLVEKSHSVDFEI